MDMNRIRQWELAVDTAEQSPISAALPDNVPVGEFYTAQGSDGIVRKWQRVTILSGNVGARWAYWVPWKMRDPDHGRERPGIGPHPAYHVVVDRIFNGDAAHFVGMLAIPYVGKIPGSVDSTAWVLVEPRAHADQNPVRYSEPDPVKERYEKSKEVYDVETQKSKRLP